MDLLKQRYGNIQVVISAHMDEMLKLPDRSGDKVSVRDLREFWEINDILEIIRKELGAREIGESVRTGKDELRRKNEPWRQNRQQNYNFSASSLFVEDGRHERKIKCVYCGQNHYSASCEKVKDNEERKSILRDQKRCYLYLQGEHRIYECENGRNCRWWNGKHHLSICSKMLDHLHQRFQKIAIKHINKTIPVPVLLDSGSQRSYITNYLKKRLTLGLRPVKKETLTFGQDKFKKQKCDVVNLSLKRKAMISRFQLFVSRKYVLLTL